MPGALQHEDGDGTPWRLTTRNVVGRAPTCELAIDQPWVSREHAVIAWTRGAWQVRDLGSKNGTTVHGKRLAAGEAVRLAAGAVIGFGDTRELWRLVDAEPPALFAQSDDGRQQAPRDDVLELPDGDAPELTVVRIAAGQWVAELADEVRAVRDRSRLDAGGRTWTIRIPGAGQSQTRERDRPGFAELELHFTVSRNEEFVELTLSTGGQTIELPPRTFTYTLLTLARLRLERPDLEPADRGWIHREDLSEMLGLEPANLSMQVTRARRQLAAAGVQGAARLIERRSGSGELRLGTDRIAIREL